MNKKIKKNINYYDTKYVTLIQHDIEEMKFALRDIELQANKGELDKSISEHKLQKHNYEYMQEWKKYHDVPVRYKRKYVNDYKFSNSAQIAFYCDIKTTELIREGKLKP